MKWGLEIVGGMVMIKVRGRIKVERRRRLVRVRGCRSWLVIE